MTELTLQHSVTGEVKQVPTGFSWTTLFFGFFPALFRGDIKWAIGQLLLAMLTAGISWFIMPFFYNGWYINGLTASGWFNPAMPNRYANDTASPSKSINYNYNPEFTRVRSDRCDSN